jgi:hypothetical protein
VLVYDLQQPTPEIKTEAPAVIVVDNGSADDPISLSDSD